MSNEKGFGMRTGHCTDCGEWGWLELFLDDLLCEECYDGIFDPPTSVGDNGSNNK